MTFAPRRLPRLAGLLLCAALPLLADEKTPVERSNQDSQILLGVFARFAPETAGRLGVPGLDEEILDLKPGVTERSIQATEDAVAQLKALLDSEKDPYVRLDLQLVIDAGERNVTGTRLGQKYDVPYFDLPQTIFSGIRALLDDQVAPERRDKALVRLRKYAGLEPGTTPLVTLAEDRTRERLSTPGLHAPFKDQLEKDLGNGPRFTAGIGQLFDKYRIEGYQEAYGKLKKQLSDYETFVRTTLRRAGAMRLKVDPARGAAD